MYGGLPPNPPSATELKAAEDEAYNTVQKVVIWSALLYLSPFVIDYVKKLI